MFESEKIRGLVLIIIALLGFSLYSYVLFATEFGITLLKITIIIIVGIIFFIIGWIGYTLTSNEKDNQ